MAIADRHHEVEIMREYIHDEAIHRWHARCSCGWQGAAHLSPKQAERDGEGHEEAVGSSRRSCDARDRQNGCPPV